MTGKTEADALAPGDYEALSDLRYALKKFTEFSTGEAMKLGLTPQQHQALLAIKGLPPEDEMTVAILAERILTQSHSATALVNRLAEAGYVGRRPSRADARRQAIFLLPKGERALEKLSGTHLHEIRVLAPELMQALCVLQDRRRMEKIAWMA